MCYDKCVVEVEYIFLLLYFILHNLQKKDYSIIIIIVL